MKNIAAGIQYFVLTQKKEVLKTSRRLIFKMKKKTLKYNSKTLADTNVKNKSLEN